MGAALREDAGRLRPRGRRGTVMFLDETGFRTAGVLHWLHSASTGMFVHLSVHRRHGVHDIDAARVLPDFTRIAMHDAWAPYNTYTESVHAFIPLTSCGSWHGNRTRRRGALRGLPGHRRAAGPDEGRRGRPRGRSHPDRGASQGP
ncbi:transposase [Kitasatospora indigofera]